MDNVQLNKYTEEELKFYDIAELEEWREYVFSDNNVYRIEKPVKLHVKRHDNGDSHRVIDAAGIRHYVPAGWIAMRFSGQWGLA